MIRAVLGWWREWKLRQQQRRQALEAARNMEPDDCNIATVGNGKYTREIAERRCGRREGSSSS